MNQKFKKMLGIVTMMFLTCVFFVAVLTIWDFMDRVTAREAMVKIIYTFVVILITASAMTFLSGQSEKNS